MFGAFNSALWSQKTSIAGEIKTLSTGVLPEGFLRCDGRPISRAQYPRLFQAIGTSHGDGSQNSDGTASGFSGTHFNLPDFRGMFLRGLDGTKGNDPDKAGRTAMKAGGATGNALGSVQLDENKAHGHKMNGNTGSSGGTGINGTNTALGATYPGPAYYGPIYNEGGNESRPKNAYVEYIIRF